MDKKYTRGKANGSQEKTNIGVLGLLCWGPAMVLVGAVTILISQTIMALHTVPYHMLALTE